MRTLSVQSPPVRSPASSVRYRAVSATWARSVLIRALAQIRIGHLVLQDGARSDEFGIPYSGLSARIVVRDPAFYQEVVSDGALGAGDAYIRGHWDSPDLAGVVRLLVLNRAIATQLAAEMNWLQSLLLHLLSTRSVPRVQATQTAERNLNTRFFATFLDPALMYSTAIFRRESDTLEQASVNKLWHICERLQLRSSDRLLDIGSSWGSMAVHAAKHYGCHVTAITGSILHFEYVRERVYEEGLEDRIEVRLQEYADIRGTFDKIVCIEMVEETGRNYYEAFFRRCSSLLTPSGLMLLQELTLSARDAALAASAPDFVQRFVRLGGTLTSTSALLQYIAQDTDMQVIGLEDLTHDSALTTQKWRENFTHNVREVESLGFDEEFIRTWELHLACCHGGFRERLIHSAQLLLAKPGFRNTRRPS